jgi:hypothetical protein
MRELALIDGAEWQHHLVRLPSDARRVADQAAIDAPDPFSVGDGLTELLLNGIEHGNLEIGNALKGELLEKGRWGDEVERRLEQSKYMHRKVLLLSIKSASTLTFIITDEGSGFDYASRNEEPEIGALNGRGLKLARELAFDLLEFKGRGNVVVAQVDL